MTESQTNPRSSFDVYLCIAFLLGMLRPAGRASRPLFLRLTGLPDSDDHGLFFLTGLFAVVVAMWVFEELRARVERSQRCRVLVGALVALGGALVIYFLAAFLGLAALVLLGLVLPAWAVGWPFWPLQLVAVALASCWAGWRFGKWGYFWGCASFALAAGTVMTGSEAPLWSLTVRGAIIATFMLLLSAAAGQAGARRFQARLRKEQPGQVQQPAAESHPG